MSTEPWAAFAPFEAGTIIPAGLLVAEAGVVPGQRVLDVGCGTGVVAVTAARQGAIVSGLDPSAKLLDRARENAGAAQVEVEWIVGRAEKAPFESESFDVVLSQFGHIFAPSPEAALAEILRVLKPHGTFVYNAWPSDGYPGLLFSLIARYGLEGSDTPLVWSDLARVDDLFGPLVDRQRVAPNVMTSPCLSPHHVLRAIERSIWPVAVLVERLQNDPATLGAFRAEALDMIRGAAGLNKMEQPYVTIVAQKR